MKYAENNRISHRQLYHQIILSFLAPLLICIPGYNGEQGLSGAVGIMAAVLILLLYVFFLMRTSYCYADPVKIMGKRNAMGYQEVLKQKTVLMNAAKEKMGISE